MSVNTIKLKLYLETYIHACEYKQLFNSGIELSQAIIGDIYFFMLCAIVWKQYLRGCPARKPQICRWNIDAVSHNFRKISSSGFDGHVAISDLLRISVAF